ncbi:hypothetical protein MMC10_007470 [Thelotrema lepadinum]|nr:hypothetical protein [Thelotrema lepadinum]
MLSHLIPNSTYIRRSAHRFAYLQQIADFARNRGYTSLVVLLEEQKRPHALKIILLSSGLSVSFAVKTWVDGKVLPNHGVQTDHVPELILNNFVTPLGYLVGSILQRIFPQQPDLRGRQVITIHNQRDFLFLRQHRYLIRHRRPTEKPVSDVEYLKVGLQELGPRLSLKLREISDGSKTIWRWQSRMDKKRTSFQL